MVKVIPEYDDGRSEFVYILVDYPDGGRARVIQPNIGLDIPPIRVGETDWLIKATFEKLSSNQLN